jgi:hypothetical protein
MKKLRQIMLLLIILIHCSSCALVVVTAAAGAVVLGIDLAGNAAKKSIKNGVESRQEGSINISNVALEKSEIDSSNVLIIHGTLQVIPGTKNNEHFRNLSNYYFVFLLYDNKSQLLKRISQKIESIKDGDSHNVEVNKSYQFLIRVENMPKSIFILAENVKYEKVIIENSNAQEKSAVK